jgi:hypothetical protein
MAIMVIAFIVLTVMLVLGISIMMNPHFFVLQLQEIEKSAVSQPFNSPIMPKEIIIIASILIIIGVAGLSVLGFRIFKELRVE